MESVGNFSPLQDEGASEPNTLSHVRCPHSDIGYPYLNGLKIVSKNLSDPLKSEL